MPIAISSCGTVEMMPMVSVFFAAFQKNSSSKIRV